MDYGDRQERAEWLLEVMEKNNPDPHKIIYTDWHGQEYTAEQLAEHIECQTDLGTTLVAVAGLIIQALYAPIPKDNQ